LLARPTSKWKSWCNNKDSILERCRFRK